MSKNTKIFFAVSVALNVFLIGGIVGHILNRVPPPFWGKPRRGDISQKVSPEKRGFVNDAMIKLRQGDQTLREKTRKARQAVFDTLTAAQFDEQAYQEEVEKLNTLREQRARRLSETTRALAKRLSQDDRMTLARHLHRKIGQKMGRRGGGGRGRRGGGGWRPPPGPPDGGPPSDGPPPD